MSPAAKTLLAVLAVAVVAFAQTGVLAWMVVDRIHLLSTGREIVLQVVPFDPRDLFRGEYVYLNYPAARVSMVDIEGGEVKRDETIYVTLEKSSEGEWRPVGVSRTLKVKDGPGEGPDRIVLKARSSRHPFIHTGPTVRYGIERYFVREGDGPKLEAIARDSKLAVLVAVGKDGTAAIKGLIIDGKLQYEEPVL